MRQQDTNDARVNDSNECCRPILVVDLQWRRSPEASVNLIHDCLHNGANGIEFAGFGSSD